MTPIADLDAWLATTLPRVLPDFLPARRWFGGKARAIVAVDVDDAVWLAVGHSPCALVVAGVRHADGGRDRYAMLLAFTDAPAGQPIVGRMEQNGVEMWVSEAAADAHAARSLLRGFAAPQEVPTRHGGRLRYGDIGDAAAGALAGGPERWDIRAIGTEQSNTSVRLDRTLVFKLFRRLDEGENPELEVSRFLTTRTSFRAMPLLRGSVTHVSAAGGESTVGVLQDWIDNRGDGWSYVLAQLRQPAAGGSEILLGDLFGLGATTADFHAALAADPATPAFAPEPVTSADVDDWQGALRACATRTLLLVERSVHGFPENARDLAANLLDLRSRVTAPAQLPAVAEFQKIRVHGDYHLGQTLKTADGFALIDFEGEPARPLAERRLKHCALKDVAGMIRSFDYAVETIRQEHPHPADVPPPARLRDSFLDGYLRSAARHRSVFLPEDRRALEAWIDFFEMEKALYEVEYEINNRPAWAHIPLRGILRILRGRAN